MDGLSPCKCEHPKNAHGPRPLYYGSKEQEMDHSCYHCYCDGYQPDPNADPPPVLQLAAYLARRASLGLPDMRVKGDVE
jgi:hypothetical protein